MTELWSYEGTRITCGKLGIKLGVTSEGLGQILKDQPVVVVVYHPFTEFLYAFGTGLHDLFLGRRVMPTAKREHIWNPLGWGILAAGGALIPRTGNGRGVRALRRSAENALRDASGMGPLFVIFWDGHRPRRERIEEAQAYLQSIGEDAFAKHLKYVQVPRLGGLQALMSALPGAALVEVTMSLEAWPANGNGYQLGELRGRTLHLHYERVDPPELDSGDRAHLQKWLRSRAALANNRIAAWIAAANNN